MRSSLRYFTNVKNDTWGPRAAGTGDSWPSLAHTSSLVTKSAKYLKQQKAWKHGSVQKTDRKSDTLVAQWTVGYWGRPRAAVSFTNGGHPPYNLPTPPPSSSYYFFWYVRSFICRQMKGPTKVNGFLKLGTIWTDQRNQGWMNFHQKAETRWMVSRSGGRVSMQEKGWFWRPVQTRVAFLLSKVAVSIVGCLLARNFFF